MQLLLLDGTAFVAYFRTATMDTNPVAKQLYDKLVANNKDALTMASYDEMGKMLENDPKLVLFSEFVITPTLMSAYPCDVVTSKTEYYKVSTRVSIPGSQIHEKPENPSFIPRFRFPVSKLHILMGKMPEYDTK